LGPTKSLGRSAPAAMGKSTAHANTKLKREVALKILPQTFAADPERCRNLPLLPEYAQGRELV
jgi:hypothetical protein